jgi:2-dehydro-3-deoxyphosphogluconate aldolase/(4S)-4-hydroxy-2-oxoglutarate aldolase
VTLPRLIAVVRGDTADECRVLIRGVIAAGIEGVEITMTIPGGVDLIEEFASLDVVVGAGTVLDARAAADCVAAGARFVVSPVSDEDAARVVHDAARPYVGGALTPTEIVESLRIGCDAVKIFPIGAVGGPGYLRTVREPFPELRAVVSGGVVPADVAEYRRAGAASICMGGALLDRDAGRRGDVEAVTAKAAAVLSQLEEARSA